MREHEVPTHVQAEDRVLLWFTFPQIVAMTAVCALSYGVYRYAPVGPSEVRMALAVAFGLAGMTMVVGKIGGRRLPLVVADLLRYRLGPRRYVGPAFQLVRSEPLVPAQPVRSGPGPLRLMAKRLRRTFNGLRRKRRKDPQRRNGRRPFRPRPWLGKGSREEVERENVSGKTNGNGPVSRGGRRRSRFPRIWTAVVATALAVSGHNSSPGGSGLRPRRWGRGGVSGRSSSRYRSRCPGEESSSKDWRSPGATATVTLRAATDLDLSVRALRWAEG